MSFRLPKKVTSVEVYETEQLACHLINNSEQKSTVELLVPNFDIVRFDSRRFTVKICGVGSCLLTGAEMRQLAGKTPCEITKVLSVEDGSKA